MSDLDEDHDATDPAVVEAGRAMYLGAGGGETDSAQTESRRLRALKPAIRRRMQVLTIWCESGSCCVGRVYRVRGGRLLLQLPYPEARLPKALWREEEKLAGTGYVRGEGAQWLTGFDPGSQQLTHALSSQFTCDCQQTAVRTLDHRQVRQFSLDDAVKSVSCTDVEPF